MAQPTPYDRDELNGETYFTDWTTSNPSTPQQGNKLDQEFNAIALTLADVLANLALIQRDDGQLANDTVGRDALRDEVAAGVNTPTSWVTGTLYSVRDSVIVAALWYWATTEATASASFTADVAAGYWSTIFDFTSVIATGVLAGPTDTPAALGGAQTVGSSTKAARADHVHTVPVTDELYLSNVARYFT